MESGKVEITMVFYSITEQKQSDSSKMEMISLLFVGAFQGFNGTLRDSSQTRLVPSAGMRRVAITISR